MTYFSPDQLKRIVSETLPQAVGPAHHNAVVVAVDQAGAQVVASFTRPAWEGATWAVQAAVAHQWTGDTTAAARVVLSW